MSSETARYVERLRGHLHLGDALESDFVRELEAHVEDRIAHLHATGVPVGRAQQIAIHGFGRPQALANLMRQAHQSASWTEALLAALPYTLIAALLAFRLWTHPVVIIAAAALVVSVTLYGLWAGRPAWFYPWAGVALLMPVFAGYIAFAVLTSAVPQILAGDATPYSLAGLAGASLYFPVGIVVVAISLLVAVRRDWLDASMLISPSPLALVCVIQIHSSGGLLEPDPSLSGMAPILALVSLCAGIAAAVFLRATTRNLRFMTLVASALFLLSAATLLADPSGGVLTLGTRGVMLLAFLLSPALVARHA